jgi:hypothetical protein
VFSVHPARQFYFRLQIVDFKIVNLHSKIENSQCPVTGRKDGPMERQRRDAGRDGSERRATLKTEHGQ